MTAALFVVSEEGYWGEECIEPLTTLESAGVDVTETKTRSSEDFRSLLTVTVGDGEDELAVSGTLFTGDEPRLVSIDGYRVDALPHGHMLVARNEDAPGVIGLIGTVLGEHGVNIAGMYNARETIGGEALTVYSLDNEVPEEALAALVADDRIMDVEEIDLSN
jgi:D-3-phosphoglycerate dehydrogenase